MNDEWGNTDIQVITISAFVGESCGVFQSMVLEYLHQNYLGCLLKVQMP